MRERSLVVWLDREGHYTPFVDGLIHQHQRGQFFAPVVGFRGSFLETMLRLESYQDGLDPEPLLLHVPGHTDQSIRSTPLLEFYKAGVRFERSLDTLVREIAAGNVSPESTEELLKQANLTFHGAEEWLSGQSGSAGVSDGYLQNLKPEWVLDSLVTRDQEFLARVGQAADLQALRDYLSRHTGFSRQFEEFFHTGSPARDPRDLTDAFLGWLLCVEYANDLTRPPDMPLLQPLSSLSPPLKRASKKLCEQFRERFEDEYKEVAGQTESMIEEDLKAGNAEDLGKIDTFSREDSRLLEASVEALAAEHWEQALRWATSRLESPSVWLTHDQLRRQEWQLVKVAAELGLAIVSQPLPLRKIKTLSDAIEVYTGQTGKDGGVQSVDRAHRQFEQDQARLLIAKLPHFALLQSAADRLRTLYRQWVDSLNRDFAMLCANNGFLPEPSLQQRYLYEQEVHPRLQGPGRVAFFLVDALRYEMAVELAERLQEKETRIHLRPRLAELPSITSVGMNVLAPVCQDGKLTVEGDFLGFRVGEYTVSSGPNRLRAMAERSLEKRPKSRKTPVSYKLQELLDTSQDKLKQKVKENQLVVVHSREIDVSGEADVGVTTFNQWIGHLRSAVLRLHAAGVEEFVITADHGFLLLDKSATTRAYNGSAKVDRRWVLTDSYELHEDMDTVSLDALGYDGRTGHLMFLRDSGVFNTRGKSAYTFVHGGNSLQERVIPVLHISYAKQHTDLNMSQYRIEAEELPPALGCSRLKVRLVVANQLSLLSEAEGEKITLAFRVLNQPGQVIIKDAPGAEVFNQQLLVETDKPVEVYFTVHGSGESKASIELYHPDNLKAVEPFRPAAYFLVDVKTSATTSAETTEADSGGWYDNLPEDVRAVFLHIEQHGSITETEVITMLGSPRKQRSFTSKFQDYVKLLPFDVQIESATSGKRWNKV